MTTSIDFYFDFSSSYSYLALPGLERLAAERGIEINWMPIVLGVIFKVHDHAPPAPDSAKGHYVWRDVVRTAEQNGQAYQWPKPFPYNSMTAARVFWHIAGTDAGKADEWAKAVFNAAFGEGRDCSNPEVLGEVAASLGLDAEATLAATGDDTVKAKLREVTGQAMERGVFGAPTFFLGDEMYWGNDRLNQLEAALD
jgi:2-hydroxychromene-2-carboxylate isomerase